MRQRSGRSRSGTTRGSPHAGFVRDRLSNDPHWNYRTADGRWICPYCLSAVRPPASDARNALQHAIEKHLGNRCSHFQDGHGTYQRSEDIAAKLQHENIAYTAMTDPAWQVFDHEGCWYSPASLRKVPSVRLQNRRFDAFTVSQIVRHLASCPHFAKGVIHPAKAVQQARDQGMRIDKLAVDIERLLGHAIWRYRDRADNWVCPYCLRHDTGVVIGDQADWGAMTPAMARHLLVECAGFSPKHQHLKSEDEVRGAAQEEPPSRLLRKPTTVYRRARSDAAAEPGAALGPADSQEPTILQPGTTTRFGKPTGPPVARPVAQDDLPRPSTRLIRPEMVESERIGKPGTQGIAKPITTGTRRNETRRTETQGIAKPVRPTTRRAASSEAAEPPPPTASATPKPPTATTPSPQPMPNPALPDEPASVFDGDPFADLEASFPEDGDHLIPVADEIAPPPPAALVESTAAPATERPAGAGPLDDDDDALSWMDSDPVDGAEGTRRTPTDNSDLEAARNVQIGLLREAPDLPGYTFASRFESCSEVSGDFYEFIRLRDGRIGFAQADVSGHGMQAGLIMSMAKKVLSIYAKQMTEPSKVLAAVNEDLVDDLGGKMFISMTYAILDPTGRTITWARAGHNPTIRFNIHTREYSEVNPPGMVVGMKGGSLFGQVIKEEVTQLQTGDLFLLYTDGVTETMNRQGEEYGTELLQELIERHASADLEMLLDRILDSVRGFRGGTDTQDDMTLLALLVD